MALPDFDFHELEGAREGNYSTDINGPWCTTFEWEEGSPCRVDVEQYH